MRTEQQYRKSQARKILQQDRSRRSLEPGRSSGSDRNPSFSENRACGCVFRRSRRFLS